LSAPPASICSDERANGIHPFGWARQWHSSVQMSVPMAFIRSDERANGIHPFG